MRITNTLRVLVSVLPENLRQEGRTLAAAIEAPSAYEMVRPLGIAEAHAAQLAHLASLDAELVARINRTIGHLLRLDGDGRAAWRRA